MTGPPRIIVMGMYRAGSTRIFNIVREQLLRGTPDARVGHFGDLESIDRTVTIPGPFILKEHEVGRAAVERIRSGDVVALVSWTPLVGPPVMRLTPGFRCAIWSQTRRVFDMPGRCGVGNG